MATPTRTHRDPTVAGQTFDTSGALRSLGGLQDAIRDEMAKAVEQETAIVYRQAQATAPIGSSGNYRRAIRTKIFRDSDQTKGAVFAIQGKHWMGAKRGFQTWAKNLPIWLEYGTSRAPAKPHLIPAFEAGKRRLADRVYTILTTWAAS